MSENEIQEQTTDTATTEEQEQSTEVQEQSTETPAPSTDVEAVKRELNALYLGALSEKSRQIEELQSQLSTKAPEKLPEVDATDFLSQPGKHIDEIVHRALERQLAPIQNLAQQFNRQNALAAAKQQFTAVPQYKQILETYGDVVDTLLNNQAITPQNVQAAITMIPGLVQMGQIPAREVTKSNVIPATIPPSAPPPPRKVAEKSLNITDEEKRIAKRLGMSEEQFVQLRDAPPDVNTWKKDGK